MDIQFHLPSSSLAEFVTRKISAPTVSWTNGQLFSELDALANAYCIPGSRDDEADYLPFLQRVQAADRYGGYGVGYCGGSARCGIYGDVQVKGVGLTPLLGASPGAPPDPWHSSGTVTMNEAGREAIWSSICGGALPFGAVSTQAVVLTGTRCNRTDLAPGHQVFNRRALIMRAFALRPAHFMQNIHFKTSLVFGTGVCEDVTRVRQMVQSLPSVLELAFGPEVSGESLTETVSNGIRMMARRFASQVAAAFAKRLYHGSLGCSNIAMDGRYMDFGTMTAVSAYRRQAGSPLWPDQWSQHTPLLRTLSYLLFHVAKHMDCAARKTLVSTAELTAEFNTLLNSRMQIELLKQMGIPEQTITAYPEAKRSGAYRCLKEIYSRGADTSFVWRGDDDPSMVGVQPLQSLGRYDLNEILTQAAQSDGMAPLHTTAQAFIDDAALATEFQVVYTDLKNWFLSTHPSMDATVASQFLARQSARLNSDVSHLTRESLDLSMAAFEVDPSGLGAYIDGTIRSAGEILNDEPPDMVDLHNHHIAGSKAQLDVLTHMDRQDAITLLAASPLQCVDAQTNARMRAVCATA